MTGMRRWRCRACWRSEVTKKEGQYAGDRLGHLCAESRQAYEAGMSALNAKFRTGFVKTDPDMEMTPVRDVPAPDNLAEAEAALGESAVVSGGDVPDAGADALLPGSRTSGWWTTGVITH